MIILDSTTESLRVVLSSAVTTNELHYVVSYIDVQYSSSLYTPINNDGLTTGTTPVTIVASPSANIQRMVKFLTIYNADTVAAIVTVEKTISGVDKVLCKIKIDSGETLQYADGEGFSSIDSSTGSTQVTNQYPLVVSGSGSSVSSGTLILSNSNSLSFSNNAGTITGTYSYNTLNVSFAELGGEYQSFTVANVNSVSYFRTYIPFNLTATRLNIIAGFSLNAAASTTNASWSINVGLYTKNATDKLLRYITHAQGTTDAAAGGATSDSNSWSGISGVRNRTIGLGTGWTFTPGEYWFGIAQSFSNPNGSTGQTVTYFGQSTIASKMGPVGYGLNYDNGLDFYYINWTIANTLSSQPMPTLLVDLGYEVQPHSSYMRVPTIQLYGSI